MSNNDTLISGLGQPTEQQSIAVGIIATEANSAKLAQTVLRANERQHEVYVTHGGAGDIEAVRFAERLNATIVEQTDTKQDVDELRRDLAATARADSCDGLIFQNELCARINYERSESALQSAGFAVDAVPAASTPETGQSFVVAGIPAYNEAGSIAEVVEQTGKYVDSVLVIDDGSDDNTAACARESGATVVEHKQNRGYGASVKSIFAEVRRRRVDSLVIIDGDGQHDPADIPALLDRQRSTGASVVIGSRFVDGGQTEAPLWRRVGLSMVNICANLSLGIVRSSSRIRDTQSGFRAYNREAIQRLADDQRISDSMGASTDILYIVHAGGYDIEEVGTTITYGIDDTSTHHPVTHGIRLLRNIIRVVESERPVTMLGIPGLVSTLVGIGFGYWTLINYLSTGGFPLGLAIVSTFFILVGVFSSFTSIILHSLNRQFS